MHKGAEDFGSCLKEWMTSNDLQKPLERFPSAFDYLVRESSTEDLARQKRNINPGTFPLQNLSEGFEISISSSDARVAYSESWNVGSTHNLIIRIHLPAKLLRPRFPYFNLEIILRDGIHFLERLSSSFELSSARRHGGGVGRAVEGEGGGRAGRETGLVRYVGRGSGRDREGRRRE